VHSAKRLALAGPKKTAHFSPWGESGEMRQCATRNSQDWGGHGQDESAEAVKSHHTVGYRSVRNALLWDHCLVQDIFNR
jgi:hypothetical protein